MNACFKSVHHPGYTARGLVYVRRLAGPIGACTVPLMIGATAAALQGQPIWHYLIWGLPGALVLASAWTHFMLSSTPAELKLRGGQCAVRSVHDILYDRDPDWTPLYAVQEAAGEIRLSLGWRDHIFRRSEWPQFAELRRAVKHAFDPQHDPSTRSSLRT